MSITAFPAPTRSVVSVTTKTLSAAGSERLGRVLPNLHITVTDVTVKGWPWNTKVFAQWDGKATLLNGGASFDPISKVAHPNVRRVSASSSI